MFTLTSLANAGYFHLLTEMKQQTAATVAAVTQTDLWVRQCYLFHKGI